MPDVLGATGDDVRALQRAVAQQYVAVAESARAVMAQLDAPTQAAWNLVATRALSFTSAPVPLFIGLDNLYQQGRAVFAELQTVWPQKLAAFGAPPVTPLPQVPAPPPPGSGKSFWQASGLSDALPLVLLLFAWDAVRKK